MWSGSIVTRMDVPDSRGESPVLLVVGDQVASTTSWIGRLRALGFKVLTTKAADLGSAIHAAPDLLLMDISQAADLPPALRSTPVVELGDDFEELVAAIITALHRHHIDQGQEMQRQQHALLASILESMPEGALVLDDEFCIKSMNPAARVMFGYATPPPSLEVLIPKAVNLSPGQGAGSTTGDSSEPGAKHPRSAKLDTLKTDANLFGTSFQGQAEQGHRGDGSVFPVELTIIELPSLGTPHSLAVVRDLGAVRLRKEKKTRALRLEVMGRLSSVLAHDFNNLLGGVLLQAEHLKSSPLGAERAISVDAMVAAVEHGKVLTCRLADLTRVSTTETWLDVRASLEQMNAFIARILGDEIRIEWHIAKSLGHVQITDADLLQIVLNIAVNARDAMPAGGSFVLRASLEEESGRDGSHVLVLQVSDTGVGMPADEATRAFEPFFSTKGPEGSGLGLASVDALVTKAGGSTQLRSVLGKGTVIVVRLPARLEVPDEKPTTNAPMSEQSAKETAIRILVVDDHKIMRETLVSTLSRVGHECLEASSVGEALSLVEAHGASINLMLADISMPLMNGAALGELVRKSYPDIATILMTGSATSSEIGGTTLLLDKPFDLVELQRAIHGALPEMLGRTRETTD